MKSHCHRRSFLGFLTAVVAAAAALGPFRLIARAAEKWISVGKVDDFIVGGAVRIEDEKLYIFRSEEGFSVLSGKCTHMGCFVDRIADGTFECPCHNAAYDETGRVTKGPAKKDLVWRPVREENGELLVDVKGEIEM
ncbi:MAG: Rieske (2Fe-2S) protein [Deltaproteobacteria bacterium]|nr:Rieske (2Fe-2S) protein [Candidatus Zymogenaceae bacterium]